MRKKKVWRYYCEFCKKAGCSGGHLKRHEEHCTMNPNRTCGMCEMMGGGAPDLQKVMQILPNPDDFKKTEEKFGFISFSGLEEATDKVLQELRDAVENCPACIMAALRQKGIPVPIVKNFNFTEECKSAWADFNEAQRESDYGYG